MTASAQSIKLAELAALAASGKVAENIVALDVSDPMPLADIFLMVSARNERQVGAIADEIEDSLLQSGTKLRRIEGKAQGRWVLMDFGDLVVHVMHEEERMHYSIERLWKDCPVIKLQLA